MIRKAALSAALLLVAATVAAQLHIVSISPSSAPVAGGTPVDIQIAGPVAPCPILTPPPQVVFDTTQVKGEIQVGGLLRAVAPPHPAGTVDIRVQICGNPELVASRAFNYFAPGPPDPASFERVLFPVFFFGPGAQGSLWVTTALAFNDGTAPVEMANPLFEGDPVCPAVCGCSARKDLQPRETNAICSGFAYPGGIILYAPRTAADDLEYNLRIRDVSRSTESAGTEVPVVRERDLRSGRIVLLNVLAEQRFRTTLRVYDVQGRDGVQVRMQIYRSDSPDGALVDRVVTLSQPIRDIIFDPFPSFPAYAYVPDPVLEVPVASPTSGPYRIELTALAPLDRFWAFVSITNNDTQQVTVVTPQ